MRFRSNAVHCVALLAACMWLFCASPSVLAQETTAPTDEEIAAAIAKVKQDPNLAQERKTRSLRWKDSDTPKQPSSFARWIGNFFGWVGQLSRALVWVIGGLLLIALAWYLVKFFGNAGVGGALAKTALVPTHVRDLDIRPESLPDDIGAAALAMWQQGEHRAALALLYRGLLSRLAHVHAVPIRDSSTEGDVLELAALHLQPTRSDYVSQLIRTWQRATYGGREPQSDEVESLCSGFAGALAPARSTNAGARA